MFFVSSVQLQHVALTVTFYLLFRIVIESFDVY